MIWRPRDLARVFAGAWIAEQAQSLHDKLIHAETVAVRLAEQRDDALKELALSEAGKSALKDELRKANASLSDAREQLRQAQREIGLGDR